MLEFDLARNALRHLVKMYGIKEIYIPYYLCHVVRNALFQENCKLYFYHINDDLMPSKEFSSDSFILYPNYFGICDNNVEKLTKKYSHLIVDNAHSYYSKPIGFATITAGHKWNKHFTSNLYIGKEKLEIPRDKERVKEFFRYHEIYSKSNQLEIKISEYSVPFCYPYLALTNDIADELALELNKQGKTIYRYWDVLPTSYNEYKFYRRLVPIPLN